MTRSFSLFEKGLNYETTEISFQFPVSSSIRYIETTPVVANQPEPKKHFAEKPKGCILQLSMSTAGRGRNACGIQQSTLDLVTSTSTLIGRAAFTLRGRIDFISIALR